MGTLNLFLEVKSMDTQQQQSQQGWINWGYDMVYTTTTDALAYSKSTLYLIYTNPTEGFNKFSEDLKSGALQGYENTKESYEQYRSKVLEVYNTTYQNTQESYEQWSEYVKQGLITNYANTKEGFEEFFKQNFDRAQMTYSNTKEGFEAWSERVKAGVISGYS